MLVALTVGCFTLIFLLLPWLLIRIKRYWQQNWLSDIVLCYIVGMLLGNTRTLWLLPLLGREASSLPNWNALAEGIASGSILLSLPMLLFTNDIRKGLSYTGKMSSLFFLGVGAAILGSLIIGKWYATADLAYLSISAGMLTGVYTGGTPNMMAVSKALSAPEQLFILLNVTDVIVSGLYFLFLLSLGSRILGWVLPPFKGSRIAVATSLAPEQPSSLSLRQKAIALAKGLGLTLLIAGLSLALAMLFATNGEPHQALLWLVLTSLAIALSLVPSIRQLPVVPNMAHYLLLVFGLSAGFLANLGDLANEGLAYVQFNAWVLGLILLLYLLAAKLLGADKETFMFCTTAAILGPPFVAQIAGHLNNKTLLPIGIALSLLGLGLGNYAGMLVAYILDLS